MMSATAIASGGAVAAGSFVSVCTSIGAVGGFSAAATAATVGGAAAVGAGGTTAFQVVTHLLNKKGEDDTDN